MKILLDESLPRKLRYDFGPEHEIWSVRDKGWLMLIPKIFEKIAMGVTPSIIEIY